MTKQLKVNPGHRLPTSALAVLLISVLGMSGCTGGEKDPTDGTQVTADEQTVRRPEARPEHTINVGMRSGNSCVYEIRESKNQNLFVIDAGGTLTINALDGDVLVEIDRDRSRVAMGRPGVARRQSARLLVRQGESKSVRVRGPMGKGSGETTRHKVWLICVESARWGIPSRSIPDVQADTTRIPNLSESIGQNGLKTEGPNTRADWEKVEESLLRPPRRLESGGPEMEVEDP